MDESQAGRLRGRFVEIVRTDADGKVLQRTDAVVTGVEVNDAGEPSITVADLRVHVAQGEE